MEEVLQMERKFKDWGMVAIVGGLILLAGLSVNDDFIDFVNSLRQAKSTAHQLSEKPAPLPTGKEEQPKLPATPVLQPEARESNGFFEDYRLERDRIRSQQIETLKEIVAGDGAAEIKRKAQEQLLNLTASAAKEVEVENLLKAKNFQDVVVFLQEKGATVVVKEQALDGDGLARLTDLVAKVSGRNPADIIIIPKK